jgi:hypothetical protein
LAAQQIWELYFRRLAEVARRKIEPLARRVADEEDVALSAFKSFCQGVGKGRFPDLQDRTDLWQVLLCLVGWKASELKRQQRAVKRGGGCVRGESAFAGAGSESEAAGLGQFADSEPTPEFVAILMEEAQRRLDSLGDPVLREVALRKMEGYSNEEIAERLGCVVRTVERKLHGIRALWSSAIPKSRGQR